MFLIIPVMLVNLKVTFLRFIFWFPVILGNVFFLLSLSIVIIYFFYFVINSVLTTIAAFQDIPFLASFPNVGHICLFPFRSDLPMIVVLVISLAETSALGVHLLVVCWWSCICWWQVLEELFSHFNFPRNVSAFCLF